MSGEIVSVGTIGTPESRTDHRGVYIVDARVESAPQIVQYVRELRDNQNELYPDATRFQLKLFSNESVMQNHRVRNHTDGALQFSDGDSLLSLSYNRSERQGSDTRSEWDSARRYWEQRGEKAISPSSHMDRIKAQGYTIDSELNDRDFDRLYDIWRGFGWKSNAVREYIKAHGKDYVCAIRDHGGLLCAIAKIESLHFPKIGKTILESTEWGAHPDHQRRGLGTAASIGVNALALSHVRQIDPGMQSTVIFAEANMDPDSPGYKVGLDAGFVTRADFGSERPNSVLSRHVSVGHSDMPRNFLLMQLDQTSMNQYYSPEAVEQILRPSI